MKSQRRATASESPFRYSGPKSWREVEDLSTPMGDETKEEIRMVHDDTEDCGGLFIDNRFPDDRNSSAKRRSRRPTGLVAACVSNEKNENLSEDVAIEMLQDNSKMR
mmetsp:Transcript_28320/g.42824  ORF Transcript_28320/g.42824 Transcript_28320/m.42824 type:complete len:107 (-) Transcript_28320:163-483(-)